jgi:hypothetical protein
MRGSCTSLSILAHSSLHICSIYGTMRLCNRSWICGVFDLDFESGELLAAAQNAGELALAHRWVE